MNELRNTLQQGAHRIAQLEQKEAKSQLRKKQKEIRQQEKFNQMRSKRVGSIPLAQYVSRHTDDIVSATKIVTDTGSLANKYTTTFGGGYGSSITKLSWFSPLLKVESDDVLNDGRLLVAQMGSMIVRRTNVQTLQSSIEFFAEDEDTIESYNNKAVYHPHDGTAIQSSDSYKIWIAPDYHIPGALSDNGAVLGSEITKTAQAKAGQRFAFGFNRFGAQMMNAVDAFSESLALVEQGFKPSTAQLASKNT